MQIKETYSSARTIKQSFSQSSQPSNDNPIQAPSLSRTDHHSRVGFQAGRSTTEQIFNLRILGKSLHRLVENFRVCHKALCATMIFPTFFQVMEPLYNKATSRVLFNDTRENWFRTTVGIRLGCLPKPILFNIFL